jgi:hypothetical protein
LNTLVLHQVEGVNVFEGGSVGGNAWFGSAMTAVEVKKRLGVNSTWIIKGNSSYYPMADLSAVLKARFGTKVSGQWVVMTKTIGGVKLMDIVYAWIQMGYHTSSQHVAVLISRPSFIRATLRTSLGMSISSSFQGHRLLISFTFTCP